ncbi:MAG: radical SAM protein [Desulfobacter sp.]|nr:MAG: radical SAM protein [Desulfobacter sp.]
MNKVAGGLFLPENTGHLAGAAREFLAVYGTPALMGGAWGQHFKEMVPDQRFDGLLTLAGYAGDPAGFFIAVGKQIQAAVSAGRSAQVMVNGMCLPVMFLYHILEADDPSQSLLTVKETETLENASGFPVENRGAMQAVLDQYPVRLSRHVIRQSLVSEAVAAQYLPFTDELGAEGHTLTFDGHFKQGLMEQMYRNRAIFLLDMRCPVYCRFCFRKHKSLRKEKSPDPKDVAAAVSRVGENPDIKEILITGGEPLLNLRNLEAAVSGLLDVPHVETMRIATRSLAYYPHLFLHHGRSLIHRLKAWQDAARKRGKAIEVGVHMVHPDEVSVPCLDIISELTSSGIPVYVQTPFLKGINDTGEVLGRLFTLLRHAGAEIYYIFTPCHPIHGTQKYWSPIGQSMAAYAQLRTQFSDRAVPKLCTATPLGKMEWHTSGWAVAPHETDPDHIWIRTPYTRAYFRDMVQQGGQFPDIRENPGGTLDAKCLIDMGDPNLFIGSHELPADAGRPAAPDDSVVKSITANCFESPDLMGPNSPGNHGTRRLHPTRLETDLSFTEAALNDLADDEKITDILLRVPGADIDGDLNRISGFVRDLAVFGDRPLCIRIRWQAFQEVPGEFTFDHVSRIADLASFDPARPRRVEIESWWLVPSQVTQAHKDLGKALLARGIPVYGNMVLLSGVNDDGGIAADMAHALRTARIDFHHVYVSGLLIQSDFPPVSHARVLALASHVRMVCSGREIPLYVHWTPGGEADFGLSPGFSLQAAGSSM